MDDRIAISSPQIFFVADSHFRDRRLPGEASRRRRFARFCESLPSDSTLFLLGDIFDFYFEYRSVIPKRYLDIYYSLYNCTARGVSLHFIGGNHDYWVGDFLSEALGITVHDDDLILEGQGRTIWCTHGDAYLPNDDGYKKLRRVLRNRFLIRAARTLHPDLMDWIARRVSRESKERRRPTQQEIANHVAAGATRHFYSKGNDAFIMGHVHYPFHRNENGRDFMILGDWIADFTYARLSGGTLTLETFKSEATD